MLPPGGQACRLQCRVTLWRRVSRTVLLSCSFFFLYFVYFNYMFLIPGVISTDPTTPLNGRETSVVLTPFWLLMKN